MPGTRVERSRAEWLGAAEAPFEHLPSGSRWLYRSDLLMIASDCVRDQKSRAAVSQCASFGHAER